LNEAHKKCPHSRAGILQSFVSPLLIVS
jgi:hypothetical protein